MVILPEGAEDGSVGAPGAQRCFDVCPTEGFYPLWVYDEWVILPKEWKTAPSGHPATGA